MIAWQFIDGTDFSIMQTSSRHWSCSADVSKAFCGNYTQIRDKLMNIFSDTSKKRDTCDEAAALCSKLRGLDISFMALFWDCVLSRFKVTSESLQKADR